MTRTMETPVFLPHVVRKPFASLEIALAILNEAGHPHDASVYALVYSAAPIAVTVPIVINQDQSRRSGRSGRICWLFGLPLISL